MPQAWWGQSKQQWRGGERTPQGRWVLRTPYRAWCVRLSHKSLLTCAPRSLWSLITHSVLLGLGPSFSPLPSRMQSSRLTKVTMATPTCE